MNDSDQMKEIKAPFGYQKKECQLVIEPNEEALVQFIFTKIDEYERKPPIWGEMISEDGKIYLNEQGYLDHDPICSARDFATRYITAIINYAYKYSIESDMLLKDVLQHCLDDMRNYIINKGFDSMRYLAINLYHGTYGTGTVKEDASTFEIISKELYEKVEAVLKD